MFNCMTEFSKHISDKWNIPTTLSELICSAFEKHDSPFYLIEYQQNIAVELSISVLWEIYDFLSSMEELSTKKKRVLNALKKADKLIPNVERRVNLTTNPFDLDDLIISLRPNSRSKGQLAIKKGLDSLADVILKQQEELTPIEQLAASYIGKDPSLSSVDDVIGGVKDILAERFAYEETVRAMAREFAYDDGYLEITPKNKKDPQFAPYVGKSIPVNEVTQEELLKFFTAEDSKQVRVKLGVQLFRITELLRHHFVENPESVGFDIICEAIDECWVRLLQPIVERDVKQRLREQAEQWAQRIIFSDLEKKYSQEQRQGPLLIANAANEKNISLIAVNGKGELLGTTTERKPTSGKSFLSDRLRQFLSRQKPVSIIILDNEQAPVAEAVLSQAVAGFEEIPPISRYTPEDTGFEIAGSQWMQKEFATLLDQDMSKLYGTAIQYLKPVSLLLKAGSSFYAVSSLQKLIPEEKFVLLVNRVITMASLIQGIPIKEITESSIGSMNLISDSVIQSIKASESQEQILTKNDLLKIKGITETIFRNIAGFVVIPTAENLLDRTPVHPDFYPWFSEISEQLNASIDTIVNDPEILRSYSSEDLIKKIYVDKKLIRHLEYGIRFVSYTSTKSKRKLKLTDLKEGVIVSGRVTNITPFGVFVNINAVCDGLIHISQLADEYVETPEQVVTVNDRVDVKILKVDVKKRRISLSMKNLGVKGPKIKPSQGQLSHLAEHFKNR